MSGLINKAKDAMGGSSSGGGATGGGAPAGGKEDYGDKGLDAAEKKMGVPQNRGVNEKVTDGARDAYEKQTGKNVSDKVRYTSHVSLCL